MEIASINDTRGDFSGWEIFSVDGLTHRTAMAGVRTTSSSRAKKAADLVAAANMLDEDDAAAIREVEA
jgi:hypothetical protein